MLPAQRGDCIWLTYGEADDLHHVIIDAGPSETIGTLVPELENRIRSLPKGSNRIELLIVSHVDADHIQGVVALLSDHRRVKLFKDVWFNGYRHLIGGLLGGPDGEYLTSALESEPSRWNKAFNGGPVVVPDDGPLPCRRLAGGLEITLLTPTATALRQLAPEWAEACEKAGIVPGSGAAIPRSTWRRDQLLGFDVDILSAKPYRADTSKPNTSGIACIATYHGKSVLLLADTPADAVLAGLDRRDPGRQRFAAVKVAHHGSRRNTNLSLCERVQSKTWLVSTNGAKFGHPDPECLARIVVTQSKPTLVFNYVTPFVNDVIENAGDRYSVRLPRQRPDGTYAEGVSISL